MIDTVSYFHFFFFMQEMFEGENAEVDSAPEPSITTTKSDESNSEVSSPIEKQLIICAVRQ